MSNNRRTRARTQSAPTTPTGSAAAAWTADRIRALGATTDLRTAAQIFGLSHNTAYTLACHDNFPVAVIRAGRQYRVSVEAILAALGVAPDPPRPTSQSPPAATS